MTTPPAVTGKARKARKVRRPQKRLTGAARDNLRIYATMAYRRGDSIRTIAAATRRSYGNIHTILVDAGVTLRPRSRGASHPGATAAAANTPKESGR